MLGKEGACEINEIRDHFIIGVCPEGSEFKTVAGFLFSGFTRCFPNGIESGAVGVVFGIGAIGNNKNLHILEQTTSRPERISLVPVDLVERLTDGHTPALELDMYQRQAVDQYRHIIAIVMLGPLALAYFILINDLEAIVVDVFLVNQRNIF